MATNAGQGRLGRFLKATAIVVLLALTTFPWWSPVVAQIIVKGMLVQAGFDYPSLDIETISHTRARLRDVSLDASIPLRIGALEVTYTLGGLWRGRLREVRAIGASMTVAYRDETWDFGVWPNSSRGGLIQLPADVITLEHSTLHVVAGDYTLVVPVNGSLTQTANGAIDWRGSAVIEGSPLLMAASLQQSPVLSGTVAVSGGGFAWMGAEFQPPAGDQPWLEASIAPGEAGAIDAAVEMRAQSARFDSGATHVAVRNADFGADISYANGSVSGRLSLDADRLRLNEVSLDRVTADFETADNRATISLAASTPQIDARLEGVVVENLKSLLQRDGSSSIRGEWHAQLATDAGLESLNSGAARGSFQASVSRQEGSLDGHLTAQTDEPVQLAGPEWSATVASATVSASAQWIAGQPLQISGQVDSPSIVAAMPAYDMAITEASLAVPFRFGADTSDSSIPNASGPFAFSRWSVKGVELPALRGVAGVIDSTLELTIEASPWTDQPVVASGRIDFAGPWPDGFFDISMKPATFSTASMPAPIAEALFQIEGGGSMWMDGLVEIDRGRVVPDINLVVADASVRDPADAWSAGGVSLEATLTSFWPLAATGELRLLNAKYGLTPIDDVLTTFDIRSLEHIGIERFSAGLGELGHFRATAFTVDFNEPYIQTQVYGEHMNLRAWLTLLAEGKVEGEGYLYGRLPVTVDPSRKDRPFEIGDGYLYAEPGKGGIRLLDRNLAEQVAAGANIPMDNPQVAAEIRQRLIDTIMDFQYDVLRVDLVPGEGGVDGRVFVSGQGRQAVNPVPIGGLTFNIREFDRTVMDLLETRARLNRGSRDALDSFFGDSP